MSQQAQFIRTLQTELLAIQSEQRLANNANNSLTISSVSDVQAELSSLRNGSYVVWWQFTKKTLVCVATRLFNLAINDYTLFEKNFDFSHF